MIKKIIKFKNTFEKFKKFIILHKYHKTFNKLSEVEKSFILIEFIETYDVNILEALSYYNYMYPEALFKDKIENMIVKEFYRIEKNLTNTYVPF